jgi:hypothetical protein
MPSSEQRYKDPSLNRFTKTNLYYTDEAYLMYQDPTYLGFKLFFLFDDPSSGLLSTNTDNRNTAYAYLLRIGENQRAEYLKRFIEMLKKINSITPWFFQTIDGLGDAWKHGYNDESFKPLLPKDRKIKIGCLDESIDLRITALIDLYRKACFDWPNRREIVPQNLRYFKIGIYCYEARNINRTGSSYPFSETEKQAGKQYPPTNNIKQQQNTKKLLGDDPLENSTSTDYKIDYINDNISRVLFQFRFCEFLPDESGTFFDGMTNKEMKLSAQSISFSYRDVQEHNMYNVWSPNRKVSDLVGLFLDSVALDNPAITPVTQPDDPNPASNAYLPPPQTGNNNTYGVSPSQGPGILGAIDNYLGISGAIQNFVNQFTPPNYGDNLGNVYGVDTSNILPPIAQGVLNEITSTALGQLNNLLLGNVYGFGVGDLQAIQNANPLSLIQGGINAIQGGNNASLANNTGEASGNIGYQESISLSNMDGSSSSTNQTVGNATASLFNDDGSDSTSQAVGAPNASLANDEGSSPANSQAVGAPNASLSNDEGSSSATSQTTGTPNASLSNEVGSSSATSQAVGAFNSSLTNDDGSDSTSQAVGAPNASLANDEGSSPANSQAVGAPNASLANEDGSSPASSQTVGAPNASLTNDEGSSPASSQTVGAFNSSLTNDDGSDSTSQQVGAPNASLSNEDGSSPATSQTVGAPNASLANEDGSSPASSQTVGAPNASIANEDGSSPASGQAIGAPNASLSNEDGSSPATSQTVGAPNASLSNDDGTDSTSQQVGNPDASLSNDTTDESSIGNVYP